MCAARTGYPGSGGGAVREELAVGGEAEALAGGSSSKAPRRGGVAAAGFDAEALDFLIERGERDLEALGGFGLVPVGALEHVYDDAALDFFENREE